MEIGVGAFETMLTGSLGLSEPWYIEEIDFSAEEKCARITVGVRKNALIACPKCGAQTKRNGYETNERRWRHADCVFYPCYIHCRRPKVLCPHCGSVQVNAPFERKNSSFTLMFEGFAMMILPDMPIAKAAKLLRCNEKSLVKIMRYWVEKAVAKLDLSYLKNLAVDETSHKRGHKYVTVFIDAFKRCVVDIEKGKDGGTIRIFEQKLLSKGGARMQIETVTSDMSKAFLPAIADVFPNAENIIDKFHVKKVLIDALDEVRKAEQKETSDKKGLFRGRRLFLIPKAKMTDEQGAALTAMSKRYPKTGRAYRIVEGLDDFYSSQSVEDAERAFSSLYSWMKRCRLEPMKKAAETLNKHRGKIMGYFKNRLTNAICEGINSLIQAAKRKARGYATFEGYSAMIYLVAGKLKIEAPAPF